MARVEAMEDQPLAGGFVQEDETRTYRQPIPGNYRVIYRSEGPTVMVVAVDHAARLLDVGELN